MIDIQTANMLKAHAKLLTAASGAAAAKSFCTHAPQSHAALKLAPSAMLSVSVTKDLDEVSALQDT